MYGCLSCSAFVGAAACQLSFCARAAGPPPAARASTPSTVRHVYVQYTSVGKKRPDLINTAPPAPAFRLRLFYFDRRREPEPEPRRDSPDADRPADTTGATTDGVGETVGRPSRRPAWPVPAMSSNLASFRQASARTAQRNLKGQRSRAPHAQIPQAPLKPKGGSPLDPTPAPQALCGRGRLRAARHCPRPRPRGERSFLQTRRGA